MCCLLGWVGGGLRKIESLRCICSGGDRHFWVVLLYRNFGVVFIFGYICSNAKSKGAHAFEYNLVYFVFVLQNKREARI